MRPHISQLTDEEKTAILSGPVSDMDEAEYKMRAAGISVNEHPERENGLLVGNTYPHREELARHGATWDAKHSGWVVPVVDGDDFDLPLTTEWISKLNLAV